MREVAIFNPGAWQLEIAGDCYEVSKVTEGLDEYGIDKYFLIFEVDINKDVEIPSEVLLKYCVKLDGFPSKTIEGSFFITWLGESLLFTRKDFGCGTKVYDKESDVFGLTVFM